MIIPDANLLIYAHDVGSPWHKPASAWWENALNGDEPVGLSWAVVLAFLRITTHPSINENPLSPEQAMAAVASWETTGIMTYLTPGPEHRRHLENLVRTTFASANLINDAHLAALAISHGACLHTHDNDFARFPGLKWKNPLRG